ncbi:hypothetical protein BDV3_006755 [Batrachochytrium dendrobatidis]
MGILNLSDLQANWKANYPNEKPINVLKKIISAFLHASTDNLSTQCSPCLHDEPCMEPLLWGNAHLGSAVESLFISCNGLEHIPSEIKLFRSSLRILDASFNALQDLPNGFGKTFELLSILDLRGNKLAEFPSEIWQLINLRQLHICTNLITFIPSESHCEFDEFSVLDISGNRLDSLPSELFGYWTSLKSLNISHNQISIIPITMSFLTSLTRLNLSNNCIKTIPPAIGVLQSLIELDVSQNCIEHISSNAFEFLQNLRILVLHTNNLTSIPNVDDLISLETLDLRFNFLNTLPRGLYKLASLENLYLYESDESDEDDEVLHKLGLRCEIRNTLDWHSIFPQNSNVNDFYNTKSCNQIVDKAHVGSYHRRRFNPIEYPPEKECRLGIDAIIAYLRKSVISDPSYAGAAHSTIRSTLSSDKFKSNKFLNDTYIAI